MSAQMWFAMIAGTAIWYVLACFVWPVPKCHWCNGERPSCWRCGGRGRVTRYGRRALDALIRRGVKR